MAELQKRTHPIVIHVSAVNQASKMASGKTHDLYDYTLEPEALNSTLLDVKNILLGYGGYEDVSDLERLFLIHDAVYSYNRNYINSLHYQLKIKKMPKSKLTKKDIFNKL